MTRVREGFFERGRRKGQTRDEELEERRYMRIFNHLWSRGSTNLRAGGGRRKEEGEMQFGRMSQKIKTAVRVYYFAAVIHYKSPSEKNEKIEPAMVNS